MNNKLIENVHILSAVEIKKVTPYLDDIGVRLTPRQRGFCYYYVMNGLNGADACRKAGYSVKKGKNEKIYFAVMSQQNLNLPYIKQAIQKIIDNLIGDKKWLEGQLYEMLVVQATYDPLMFYNLDGTVKIINEEDIPKKYRCCIESLEVKYHGKDANARTVNLKLIDRKWAQDRLAKYISMISDIEVEAELTDETLKNLSDIFNGKE